MTIRIDGTNTAANPGITGADTDTGLQFGTDEVNIVTGGSTRATVDSNGRLGVGTSSPSELLTLRSTGEPKIQIEDADLTNRIGQISQAGGGMIFRSRADTADGQFVFRGYGGGSDTDFVTIDSSGRFLVGTSSYPNNARLVLSGNTGASGVDANLIMARASANPVSGQGLGAIRFEDSNRGVGAAIAAEADGTWSTSASYPTKLTFSTAASGATSPTERMRLASGGRLYVQGAYDNASGAATANLQVSSNGEFVRASSSIKYKTDVEPIEYSYSERLLDCRPVWYRSNVDFDNPNHSWWGFIAEEVAEIDKRLVHWKTVEITYDENGSPVETPCEPEPEGVSYERFVPHLLNLIKHQKEAIEALETRVAQLEGGAS